jgi:hypothetical protein
MTKLFPYFGTERETSSSLFCFVLETRYKHTYSCTDTPMDTHVHLTPVSAFERLSQLILRFMKSPWVFLHLRLSLIMPYINIIENNLTLLVEDEIAPLKCEGALTHLTSLYGRRFMYHFVGAT